MRRHPAGTFDPLDVLAVAAPPHHAEVGRQGRVPSPVHAPLGHLLGVGRQRRRQEDDVLLGHAEVVDHAGVGALDPGRPDHLAGLVGREHLDVGCVEALRLVAEADHLAGHRVQLGVGGEGQRLHAPAEGVVVVGGLQRDGIHRHRRGILLHREQLLVVVDDLGVGGAARQALHRGIVGAGVAVHAEQRAPRRVLRLPSLVPDITALVVDVAVLDAEHRDVAFPVEGNVRRILVGLGILRVRAHPVERAVQVRRQLTLDLAVVEVSSLGAVRGAPDGPARAEPERTAGGLGELHFRLGAAGRQRPREHARAQNRAPEQCAAVHSALWTPSPWPNPPETLVILRNLMRGSAPDASLQSPRPMSEHCGAAALARPWRKRHTSYGLGQETMSPGEPTGFWRLWGMRSNSSVRIGA